MQGLAAAGVRIRSAAGPAQLPTGGKSLQRQTDERYGTQRYITCMPFRVFRSSCFYGSK